MVRVTLLLLLLLLFHECFKGPIARFQTLRCVIVVIDTTCAADWRPMWYRICAIVSMIELKRSEGVAAVHGCCERGVIELQSAETPKNDLSEC